MKVADPLVEVILPFHRVDHFLLAAVTSIKSSVDIKVRVLCINDTGTNVNPEDIGLETFDTMITTSRRGYINALGTGVRASTSDYVAFLDSDDLMHPRKLKEQIFLMNMNNMDFVSCGITKINSKNQISRYASLLGKTPETNNAKELWLIGSHGADSTLLCKGKALRGHWTTHEDFEPHFADYGWALTLPRNLTFGHLNKQFYYYRSHEEQISKSPELGESWGKIYPLWINNLREVFPNLPERVALSEKESLAIAFPAALVKLNHSELKNLSNFNREFLNLIKNREKSEILQWKRTMARRILIASRGLTLRYWIAAPGLLATLVKIRFFGFKIRIIRTMDQSREIMSDE